MPTLDEFVCRQAELLEQERREEVSSAASAATSLSPEEACRKGLSVRGLILDSTNTGLYGKIVATFVLASRQHLPAHDLSSGDVVGLFLNNGSEELLRGVVVSAGKTSISLAYDDVDGQVVVSNEERFRILKLANDITYKRLKSAIEALKDDRHPTHLKHALFGDAHFSPPLQSLPKHIVGDDGEVDFFNKSLDSSQRDASRFALLQKELALIHGPPGTGKTTTLVEIISQVVRCGEKVLCCAPSNVAVDNLLERLIRNKIKVVRLGHPARVQELLQRHTLDALIKCSDDTQIVRDVRRDVDKALRTLKSTRSRQERQAAGREIKVLRKELRERENSVIARILKGADVILSTLTSASPDGPIKHLPKDHFDVVVIDECSQSLEMACWIGLQQAPRAILGGDHLQLPPTIMSEEAARGGLALTLMERVIQEFTTKVDLVRMLKVQYRMNEKIMRWASNALYDGQLVAHSSVGKHLLKDLPGVTSTEDTDTPLVLIDTSGCSMFELQTGDDHSSKANEGEVKLVSIHIQALVQAGVNSKDIAIITPYNLQVELLRLHLSERYPLLEIRSVDGFQGREKEAVVLSMVRSNSRREVGFLSERRRLNVAVTRGRRHVCVVCDAETVGKDSFLGEFLAYMESEGEVRSAMQYTERLENTEVARPEGMELVLNDNSRAVDKESKSKRNKKKNKKKPVTSPSKEDDETKAVIKAPTKKESALLQVNDDEDLPVKSDEKKKEELRKTVEEFLASEEKSYSFPPDLNSHSRMLVHQIAEELQLRHESTGVGKQRYILLRKEEPKEQETKGSVPKESSANVMVTCRKCVAEVPKANIELHHLRCFPPVSAPSGAKSKKGKGKTKKDDGRGEDLDQVLEDFSKLNNVCNADRCNSRISVMGVTCQFCAGRFCLSHGFPEAHGCGDAARRAARSQLARDRKLVPGSGRPDTLPTADKKKQLQAKLEKKLDTMVKERTAKKNSKKSS